MHRRFQWLMILVVTAMYSAPGNAVDPITVQLSQEPVTVPAGIVKLSDIATVTGGTATSRETLKRLDLELLETRESCTIVPQKVLFRIRIAGFSANEVRVLGNRSVTVETLNPARIKVQLEEEIAKQIANQFALGNDALIVRLTETNQLDNLVLDSRFQVRLQPLGVLPLGRKRLPIELVVNGAAKNIIVDAFVSQLSQVAVSVAPISPGMRIDASMIKVVEREISESTDYVDPQKIIGRTASRAIPRHSLLVSNQFVSHRAGQQHVIKRNDVLDVVIQLGRGQIRMKNARAMEPGAKGQMIEVLNPNTNTRINAIVVGPNLAEVPFAPQQAAVARGPVGNPVR